MKLNQHLKEIESRTGIRKIVWLLLGVSLTTSLLLTLVLLGKKNIVQTILVPPEVNRTLTISNISTSKEYLEEMGVFLTQLLMNASPTTVEKQHQILLNYVAPEYYQALVQELNITKTYIKRNNITTMFIPRRVTGFEANDTVKLEGQFLVSAGDKIASKTQRVLIVSFQNSGGKIAVTSIKEELVKKHNKKPDPNEDITVSAEVIEEETDAVDFQLNQAEDGETPRSTPNPETNRTTTSSAVTTP